MQNNNKGFSLVELITVIAIMSVLIGLLSYGFSLVTGKEAQQCASNISTALDKAKTYSMTKSGKVDACLVIRYDSNRGYFAEYYAPNSVISSSLESEPFEEEFLGNKSVVVTCGGEKLDSSNTLTVTYDRVNGAIKTAKYGAVPCTSIQIKRGRTYEIEIFNLTGKHTLKRID